LAETCSRRVESCVDRAASELPIQPDDVAQISTQTLPLGSVTDAD